MRAAGQAAGYATNTRARWDRTPKQLRVAVIMQAKLLSVACLHGCVCACCTRVGMCDVHGLHPMHETGFCLDRCWKSGEEIRDRAAESVELRGTTAAGREGKSRNSSVLIRVIYQGNNGV